MHDIHVVDGDSAAGSLRWALWNHRIAGEVFRINDDLSLGPLGSADARLAFLRTLHLPPPHDPDETCTLDEGDLGFERWRELQVRSQVPVRILLWVTHSASDHVLLRMASHFLKDTRAALWQVHVPADKDGFEAVAAHGPDALASFAPEAQPIPAAAVGELAQAYQQIAARPELLRLCDAEGTLRYLPIDWYDPLVLECCPTAWTPANRVVGLTMARCEPRHVQGDYFFAARLRALIQAGHVETLAPLPVGWWNWRTEVRRVAR
jgi:hypothetical protein